MSLTTAKNGSDRPDHLASDLDRIHWRRKLVAVGPFLVDMVSCWPCAVAGTEID